jgi:hypothetical protein
MRCSRPPALDERLVRADNPLECAPGRKAVKQPDSSMPHPSTDSTKVSLSLRLAGGLAVLAGLANIVADYLLRGGPAPVSGAEITLEALQSVPYDSVFIGSVLGAAVIPFWLLGLWPVYVALEPAGRWLAVPPVLLLGYMLALAPGYHGAFAFYAAGYQALGAVAGDARPILNGMIERFLAYHDAVFYLIAGVATLGSIWFVVAAGFFRTRYSRWMAAASPILVPLTVPLAQALPAPMGGYVRPILGTTIWTLFFLVATVVTWNVHTRSEPTAAH